MAFVCPVPELGTPQLGSCALAEGALLAVFFAETANAAIRVRVGALVPATGEESRI